MSKVTTLNEFILEGQAAHSFATGELTRLLNDIAVASKIVSRDVRRAGLVDHILGAQGNTNVQGEEQQKLDVVADEQFIKAFEYAHAADPNAKLYYNDYNTERPEKRERLYKLLKSLKDKGVPIDGVGLQAHWSLQEPTEQELVTAIEKYSSLGLKIQFTELDISIYPWEKNRRAKRPGESDEFTPELEAEQMAKYKMVFDVFRRYKDVITNVTFWNISDRRTWLDSYPVPGRKNYPLLFDTQLKPKKAYWEVINYKK